MDRKQTAELLTKIESYYTGKIKIEDRKRRLDDWADGLADIDKALIDKNFTNHIRTSPFPPTISDLVKRPELQSRAVLNAEDTRGLIDKLDNAPPADEDVATEALAEMRRILGIEENGGGK